MNINKPCIDEGNLSVPVIIIDVQPAYDKWCGRVAQKLMPFLNSRKGKVLAFFNGPDLGYEDEEEVRHYFIDNGIDEDTIDHIDFREKTYAFFRPWMDKGMERNHLIIAIRSMIMMKKTNSGDIPNESWRQIYGEDWDVVQHIIEGDDPIHVPDISVSELKQFNGCYLCGGAKDECLSEFRLILEAFNIKYKLIKDFIY